MIKYDKILSNYVILLSNYVNMVYFIKVYTMKMLVDLKESIKKSGFLQKDLAKELHISVIYLNRILNEKVPMTRKLAYSLSQIKSLKVKEHELMYPHLKIKTIPWPF
tara:strand:+ start:1060 stop:1380 length:321 start_codon:yes stop_codon:yes gene_type:complete